MSEHSKLREVYQLGISAANTEESKEKRKNTCLKRYGTEYALASKEIRAKINKTISEKYSKDPKK